MMSLTNEFQVPYRYEVFFTEGLFELDNPVLADFLKKFGSPTFKKKVLVCIDAGLNQVHAGLNQQIKAYFQACSAIDLAGDILVLPGGEACKNDAEYAMKVVAAINENGIDRHSFVICIGGGAFLDMVGYAAAIAHRGVKLIRVPSTVLSQNDSGVGVKNAINYQGKKNFLGCFAPAVAVFNDAQFLESLDPRDLISGISEAIKVSLIKDLNFFEWLEANAPALKAGDKSAMQYQIYRCAELHMQHIASGDPFELGSARPLDFGHWAAHKLEYMTEFQLRHGEAVAMGICLDTLYSHALGHLTLEQVKRVFVLFSALGLATQHPLLSSAHKDELFSGLKEFQEHLGGELCITILKDLGIGMEINQIDYALMSQCLDRLREF